MKIAIMQPYIFPYVGYFQLIAAADIFVCLDDVNFISRGWINRNRILVNNAEYLFSIPLKHASQNQIICNTFVADNLNWRERLLKTISQAYRRAPYFFEALPVIEQVLNTPCESISELAYLSIKCCSDYLGIATILRPSSVPYKNSSLKAQTRIIDICTNEGASSYINAPGGTALYDPHIFKNAGLDLYFLTPSIFEYQQFEKNFVPGLSIIDVMMFTPPAIFQSSLDHVAKLPTSP
jgi:hypothetical protein